jgi:hypothetical protein
VESKNRVEIDGGLNALSCFVVVEHENDTWICISRNGRADPRTGRGWRRIPPQA